MSNADGLKKLADQMAAAGARRMEDIERANEEARGLLDEAHAMLNGLAKAEKGRAGQVADFRAAADKLVNEFRREHTAAARAWQVLLKKMGALCAGDVPRERQPGGIDEELAEHIAAEL